MVRKYFTVDEANEMIPLLESVLEVIRSKRDHVQEAGRRIEVLQLLWGEALEDPSNPDHADYQRRRRAIDQGVSEIEQLVQEEILRRGLRFPVGGIQHGLIDFPTTLDGRWVFLCWHSGETEVEYWHELHTGFPGRRKITQEDRSAMGKQPADDLDPPMDM